MKLKVILIDIIHPANVHYFKYTIKKLRENGYKVIITARRKEVSYALLESEKIDYIRMGKNPNSSWGKLLFLIWCEIRTFFIFLKHRPGITLSFGATYIAHNSFLFRIPHISFDDTEHAVLNRKLYLPFTDLVLTPESFWLDLGAKQVRFPGHMELFYLTPKYFQPDRSIYNLLGIKEQDKFIILRFVSWNAHHDKGQMGLSNEYKIKLAHTLGKDVRVFISAEGDMPQKLEEYRIKIPPNEIHHVLYFAELFVGEGATMASECAAIGTPAIYVNSLNAGTLESQEKEGLIYNYRYEEGVLERSLEILHNPGAKSDLRKKVAELNKKRIDLTDFLYWLITNYPESKKTLLSHHDWYKKFSIR